MGWYVLSETKKGIAIAGGGILDYIKDSNEELVVSSGRTQEKITFHVTYYF